ncbi:speract receptor-like [Octopus vulgaris]|uniref:Guanylate cyclase n=1 Tax=Octopus vulgaris TaxID=6645 RepID=A0AA36BAS5_OCTVU|nr:speract receptor-like [Octopus vulgaris]
MLAQIIRHQTTATGEQQVAELRKVKIHGLTSYLQLDRHGNRIGYFGSLAHINPRSNRTGSGEERVTEFIRCFQKINNTAQLEIPYSAKGDYQRFDIEAPLTLPHSTRYNLRRYWSYSGMIDIITQRLIRNPRESWPPVKIMRTEKVIPPFFCKKPCGRKLVSPEDVTIFDTGTCISKDKCKCKDGYQGAKCHIVECGCDNGHCIEPRECICKEGYVGPYCEKANCTKCKYGTCSKPFECRCHTWIYTGKYCDVHVGYIILTIAAILISSFFVYFIITKLIEHRQKRAALANTDWIVDWSTVEIYETSHVSFPYNSRCASMIQRYRWKGQEWYVKFINSSTIDSKNEALILEMVSLVKLRHENLIQYGGACLVKPNVSLFVEFLDKGSLKDILQNEAVDLGWEFRFSFLKDICRGMEFIHNKTDIKSHGRLKSSNCLLNNRWTVRLTGFGANIIRFGEKRITKSVHSKKELFWTAPELLKNVSDLDGIKSGTQPGDVYSFAIVTSEIITRAPPYKYELYYLSVKEIIGLITYESSKAIRRIWEDIGGKAMLYTRPIIKEELFPTNTTTHELFAKMIAQCWQDEPLARPVFGTIHQMLTEIHPGKGEFKDNLIDRLETYSSSLEVVVIQRTKELKKSKAKAERLLGEMLPRKVANDIREGNKIYPEYFECVSVFFSDVTNFSNICNESKAFEVVDFLNEIYNAFDKVLDDYDVYKVETISDSYMVVSGLPEKNENRHAGEIATMALDLMSTVTVFEIPHMPKSTLQLRIGIHSGPVVSGVVGKLMPRYFLFGDTVNTASRMESSCYALRIQDGKYIIKFKGEYFPPSSIPSNPLDLYYSVPLNQTISRPIFAVIQLKNGALLSPKPTSNITAKVTSLDVKTAENSSHSDTWAESGGKLCQKTAWWLGYPERLNREYAKTRCGSPNSKVQLNIEIFKGEIIIDWIYHEHTILPPGPRVLRIEVPKYHAKTDTNPIRITVPAHHLRITKQPPASVKANHNFDVEVEIRDSSNKRVEDGLDSVAFVILTVPYDYKKFYADKKREMILAMTDVTLDADEFLLHLNTRDLSIRKQAVKGKVVFRTIRILDAVHNFQLNITMTMARDPFTRIPSCPSCYIDLDHYEVSDNGKYFMFTRVTGAKQVNILPMVFTSLMRIEAQHISKLVLDKIVAERWNKIRDPKTKRIPMSVSTYLPGGFSLIALDSDGRRIYSGPDSDQPLMYVTIPSGVCISSDTVCKLKRGRSVIYLSICEIIDKVKLIFQSSTNGTVRYATPEFSVRGNISIVHLGDLHYSGSGENVDSHVNTFIQLAVNDINNGILVPYLKRKGVWFSVKSIDTKNDVSTAYKNLNDLTSEDNLLRFDSIRLVISSVSSEISEAVYPLLLKGRLPFIATANIGLDSSIHKKYRYLNRVSWTEDALINSVLLASKERKWFRIITIRYEETRVSPRFFFYMKKYGIKRVGNIILPVVKPHKNKKMADRFFSSQMIRVATLGGKIIFFFAPKFIQPYALYGAYLSGLSSLHGFQWVLFGEHVWQFPFDDEGVCSKNSMKIKCTQVFAGTNLFSEQYNISGYSSSDWFRVYGNWFAADKTIYKGGSVSYRPNYIGARMGLGYDAVHLYAAMLAKILGQHLTATGRLQADELRKLKIHGLTSDLELDNEGHRIGYFGFLAQINPNTNRTGSDEEKVLEFTRFFRRLNHSAQIEIPYFAIRDSGRLDTEAQSTLPKATQYNLRRYWSYSGMIDVITQKLARNPRESWPTVKILRTEKVLPAFNCQNPCGRRVVSPEDINTFDTGICNIGNKCICKVGYSGDSCTDMMCSCKHGYCVEPEECICKKGYKGTLCNKANCTKCVHGKCIRPFYCRCNRWVYIGSYCDIHIGYIILPTIAALLISLIFGYFFIVKLTQHQQKRAALNNTDWIVDWMIVDIVEVSVTSLPHSGQSSSMIQRYKWKEQEWYVNFINSNTIDSKNEALILEMVGLIKLRHENLIQFGGACLVKPNVSLFVEFLDKGSLEDVLANEAVDLGWEFRFSFLKDICRGMEFIHDVSSIKSHGRLKSSNCLLDNRWTVRLAGFGAHIIRYGENRIPNEKTPEERKQLLWTAPELLKNASDLDDIKEGTPLGDVYSFAIVTCEIITRAPPYKYELNYLSVKDILDLVGSNSKKTTRRIWEDIGGEDMLYTRPIIKEELYPTNKKTRELFTKMIGQCWLEKPLARPVFGTIHRMLKEIHPVKGELIDNLINLLEAYSSSLEVVVIERTKELEKNKATAEQLLSQMLPRKVANDIREGNKIDPEYFECVTVFFSDIANFSNICEESNAFEIVDFLNETYNIFDEVLDDYDVYKVETISDSYMVVSGLPEKNENRHAGEIAKMALDLMSMVTVFEIPHMPKSTLQLRIGIHSGPVVSGVVGKLMPRYCLFGDTVNTASRMESSCYALRIQVSETTAGILEELGGYALESRGQINVKGRGMMTTYWLWGKDTFKKMLPDQSLALRLSKHKFK